MNKINPLYIIVVLFVVVIFMMSQNTKLSDSIGYLQMANEQTKMRGKYLRDLKNEFGNKQKLAQNARNILNQYQLLKENSTFKVLPNKIEIELKELDNRQVHKVTSKFINSSFHINAFEVEDIDFNKTLRLEIKL